VRELLPVEAADVDPVAVYAADLRPPPPGRPWVLVNMISSVDGATAIDGRSGSLGGPGDKRVFSAVRAVADVILVGAGTVRAEGYGPPRPNPERRTERQARGQAPAPRLAVCTVSLDLDLESPLFTEAEQPPLVFTTETSDPSRRAAAAAVAEVVVAGGRSVDLVLALGELGTRKVGTVVAEGGPTLNGHLVAGQLVDEFCLSLAPVLAGGRSHRVAVGDPLDAPTSMRLDRMLEEDGYLFLRYVRAA
jgi:riboflavin-specific deaminase-like protein